MQSSTEEKQQYLRINILESGYDPQDFVAFLQKNEHVQQIDIEGWSMKKIKQLVQSYKQYKYYMTKQDIQNSHIDIEGKDASKMVVMKQKLKQFQQIQTKIQYERYQPLFDYQFKAKFKCIATDSLIKNIELSKQNLTILIPNFEIKQTPGFFLGIGSKTQIFYTIQTNISKFTSKRLSEDFEWLSNALVRLFPILALPQLSEFKKQNQNSYQKRRIQLQQYMEHLSRRQSLHRSSLFLDFLTASNQKMQKLKKSYDAMGFGKGVSLLKNQNGQVDIQLSRKNRLYQQSCESYSKKVSLIHQNISQSFKKVNQSFSTVIEDLNQIVDYFADLHEAYNQLMNKFPEFNNRDYNQMLISINNLFHGISDNVKSHSQVISTHLQDYYKFNSSYDKNILKLQKYINQQEKYYLEYKFQLYRKKQRIFNQPEKWEVDLKSINAKQLMKNKQKAFSIMLSRQSKLQNDMKAWVAYLYTNFINQFDTYLKQSTQRYAIKFKFLATDLLNKDKSYLQSITKFLTESRKIRN